jgi:transposase InsO family protein
VLLAIDYFTKWVEAIPLKKVTSENMVEFVKEHIIDRFGIPQTITTGQGTQFTSSEFRDFGQSMGIKLLNSSPYYDQANGQAEASNKIMIKITQKKIDQKPKCGIRYLMKPYGLTEWLLMELHRHILMSWFMDIEMTRISANGNPTLCTSVIVPGRGYHVQSLSQVVQIHTTRE